MSDWEAYSQVEPFGFDLLNFIQAQLCCAVVAPHTKSKMKIEDFLLDFSPAEKKDKTPDEIMAILAGL